MTDQRPIQVDIQQPATQVKDITQQAFGPWNRAFARYCAVVGDLVLKDLGATNWLTSWSHFDPGGDCRGYTVIERRR